MPRFFFESAANGDAPADAVEGAGVLAAFLSFAFATRYGAQHPFAALALHLRAAHKVDMTPLSHFADRDVADDDDRADLERAWQDAAPLAETAARIVEVLESGDVRAKALVAETPDLLPALRELRDLAASAAARGHRARLTFAL
jgi:hypothetical protein